MRTIEEQNRDLADRLLDEAERNPQSEYRGKFIGIANGQAVALGEDWVEVSRQLRQLEPDAAKTYFFEIGSDGSQVHMIGPIPRVCEAPPPPVLNAIQQLNRDLGDKLIEEAQRDLATWPLGRYVGIANGKVVVISDRLSEIARELEQAESDPSLTFVVEPGRDYTKVHEIWAIASL